MDSSEFDTVDSTDTSESDSDSYHEVEVISNTEDTTPDVDKASDPEMAGPEEYSGSVQQNTSYLRRIFQAIAIFLSFFQLKFRIPERGMAMLFVFICALICTLTSLAPQSVSLQSLKQSFPSSLYLLKKISGIRSSKLKECVVCPKCQSMLMNE